ncbi:ABC transporter ATP-binding protein [Rhodococcus sp. MEB064]|uniref:ABC transporter ATP-binding protein n=1 Tax=Rhodococcus sp. MEB064 TaxID=1587522 RepID=UPI0005ABE1DB|nr:ABC transporter ATP-binding protein [Rhodococcus sp. MEB064]KIQ14366.1 ABC transporter ATP-binding protein [Rhodococcus sp. MEB064]
MTDRFTISGLTKTYGSTKVVDGLDIDIEQGEFLVLLGPSGCGKTTTLRCLAGLETPQGGRISFKDRTVFDADQRVDVPAHKRNIGMVFQSYALWPHMTVRRNIKYPLDVRGLTKSFGPGAVEAAADMVDCGALLDRYPSQLSGGQQQRVAVARGLVARPDLILFDEPLSNLDARLRDQVRSQIHRLHRELGFTAVFVTHDQSEAFALGDRLAIMKSGRIEQLDTPSNVFENPGSDYVAAFIGMANKLELRRAHDGWQTSAGDAIDLRNSVVRDRADEGESAVARLRPDDLLLHRSMTEVPPGHVGLHAALVDHEYGGRHFDVTVRSGAETLTLRASAAEHGLALRAAEPGDAVVVSFSPAALRVFPSAPSTATAADAAPVAAAVGSAS